MPVNVGANSQLGVPPGIYHDLPGGREDNYGRDVGRTDRHQREVGHVDLEQHPRHVRHCCLKTDAGTLKLTIFN